MRLILASGSERRRELMKMCGYEFEIMISRADEHIDERDPMRYVTALAEKKAREVLTRLINAEKVANGGGRPENAQLEEDRPVVLGADTIVCIDEPIETMANKAADLATSEAKPKAKTEAAETTTTTTEKPTENTNEKTTVKTMTKTIIGKPADESDAVRILKLLSGRTHSVYTGVAVVTEQGCKTECSVTKVTFERLTDDEIQKYVATGEPMDKAGAYGIQGPFGMFVKKVEGNYFTVIGLPLPTVYGMLKAEGVLPKGFF